MWLVAGKALSRRGPITKEGGLVFMDLIVTAVPIFTFLILFEMGISLWQQKSYYRVNDTISNISAGIIQQTLKFIPAFLGLVSYLYIQQHVSLWPEALGQNTWWMWLALFVLVDFQYYWFHRLSHRVNLLWSGHVVHHQSEEYNLSVALRQSFFQGIYAVPFNWPLAVLGFDLKMVVAVGALNTLAQFWIHTRAIDRLPAFFEAFLNTPSHHRVHHGRNPRYIDKNYAGAFIIWDRLFGTFEPEAEPVVYGITVPTQSWNPLRAQTETMGAIWQKVKHASNWRQRVGYLVKPPGWEPDQATAEIPFEPRQPYNPTISWTRKAAAIGLFLAALGMGLSFIINRETWALSTNLMVVGTVLISMIGLGVILDGQQPEGHVTDGSNERLTPNAGILAESENAS
jgi:sterol desaturase/sphingolipid hydroxylase (fatty acid hydroxylase superfamily)